MRRYYIAKFNVKDRETQYEIKTGDRVYVDVIIDQQNPMVFVRYGSGSIHSIPVSISVFNLAFEEVKP